MSDKFILSVPSNMEDITVGQYQKYLKLVDGLDKEQDNSEFINIKVLEIFCNAPYDDIKRMPAQLYDFALEKVYNCLNEATPHIKQLTLKGDDDVQIEFGFIPNLATMSTGEYIDLDDQMLSWENMHRAMAVLYRPIIKKKGDFYDIEGYETYEKYEDLMKHLPLNVALGAQLFFYRLGIKLLKHTLNFMSQDLTKEEYMLLQQNLSEKSGVGIDQYMQSLEEISSSLTRSLHNQYISF